MEASNYPMLALIAGLAAVTVAASALLVRSQVTEQSGRQTESDNGLSPRLLTKLSRYLFGMAVLMAVLALVLELGDTISNLVGLSSAYICEGVVALGIGMASMLARESYRNQQHEDGHG